jgi:hypothetical protein
MAHTVNLANVAELHDEVLLARLPRGAVTEWRAQRPAMEAAARQVAALLRNARHAIVFTGAGISTRQAPLAGPGLTSTRSAKIPDFRGPQGVWTRAAQGRDAPACPPLAQARRACKRTHAHP